MCGIFGYIGNRQAKDIIIKGLRNLEYRGYDSAGLSILFNNKISSFKCEGDVSALEEMIKKVEISGNVGIGHTRWATHGLPNKTNAHPHNSADNCFSIVHNGIIDNYLSLKMYAEREGYQFMSDTDSEVIAALLQLSFKGDVFSTVKKVANMLSGTFAIVVISSYTPEVIYSMKKSSPLLIGKGKDEFIISSDVYALPDYIDNYYMLNDGDFAVISDKLQFYDMSGNAIKKSEYFRPDEYYNNGLCGYDHYMIKEIFDQPKVINKVVLEYNANKFLLKEIVKNNIYIIGCGSAYNAGLIGAFVLSCKCGINVKTVIASEYQDGLSQIKESDLIIAISQSGETADTISAVKNAKNKFGCRVLSILNSENSTLNHMSDYVLYTKAGKEVSVATTKCYFAQTLMLLLIANDISDRNIFTEEDVNKLYTKINDSVELDVSFCINRVINSNIVIFVGKGIDYYTCKEASLKLKEVSYINSEAYPSGELKHGSIALVDNRSVVIVLCTNKKYLEKNISIVKEVSARGGYVLAVVIEECIELKKYADDFIVIPSINECLNSLTSIIPLQLIAYYTAKQMGLNIDKPRNLAKSVTVE